MSPASYHVMCNDTKLALTGITAELVPHNIVDWTHAVISSPIPFANRPRSSPVRQSRQDAAVVCSVTIVQDLSICRTVELNYGDVVPTRKAQWLNRCVDWLNRPRVASREIRVHRSRITSEHRNLDAEDWVAGHDVHEASAVTVPNCEYSSRVNAIGLRQIVDQIVDKPNVVDVRVCPSRSPGWI